MNSHRLKKLFAQARANTPLPPQPSADFAERVAAQLPAFSPVHDNADSISVLELLRSWFPRLAFASVFLIAICLAGDAYLNHQSENNSSLQIAQASEQWLFNPLEN